MKLTPFFKTIIKKKNLIKSETLLEAAKGEFEILKQIKEKRVSSISLSVLLSAQKMKPREKKVE